MAATPIGGDVMQIKRDAQPPVAPQAVQYEDPRITTVLRWLTGAASSMTLAVVLTIPTTLVGMRDNQVTLKAMMDSIIKSDQKQDDSIKQLRSDVTDLQVYIEALKMKQ